MQSTNPKDSKMRTRAFRDSSPEQINSITLPANTPKGASTKQINFIESLMAEREISEAAREALTEKIAAQREANLAGENTFTQAGLTSRVASDSITKLLEHPKKSTAQPTNTGSYPKVENGHYAIDLEGTLKFYKVNTPTEGRWANFTFVDAQASDEYWPIKNKDQKKAILDIIAQDPIEALKRYGQEIGSCGHCNRTLTDKVSRSFGIGPICRGKLGI